MLKDVLTENVGTEPWRQLIGTGGASGYIYAQQQMGMDVAPIATLACPKETRHGVENDAARLAVGHSIRGRSSDFFSMAPTAPGQPARVTVPQFFVFEEDFGRIDGNNNKYIEKAELANLLNSQLGRPPTAKEVD